MKTCPVCGEQVDLSVAVCPYCETELDAEPHRAGMGRVNLKEGYPTVDQAKDRLSAILASHQARGTDGLVIVHGWGSSGQGGGIRDMVRETLEHLKHVGTIRDFVRGENLGSSRTRRLPVSYQPAREDINNPGITIVKL